MKKILITLLCIPLLTSCTFLNASFVKGGGKGLRGGYGIATGHADEAGLHYARLLYITTQRIDPEFKQSLPEITFSTDETGRITTVKLGPRDNFTHKE